MPYAVKQDMIDAFGEREVIALTDRNDIGAVDDDVLTRALNDADAEINPYLQQRLQLPLANVPRIIVTYACDIARYRLTSAEAVETEKITNRYKDAIKFLSAFAAGKVSLGVDDSGQPPAPTPGGTVQFQTGSKVFGRDSTRGT